MFFFHAQFLLSKPSCLLYDLLKNDFIYHYHSVFLYLQKWNDSQLRWNTTDYDNIATTVMSPEFVWTPDVVLYNT